MTTTAKQHYQTILKYHGEDAAYIANVILVAGVKPTTRLGNLLSRLRLGDSIRPGTEYGSVFVNGTLMSFATAFNTLSYSATNCPPYESTL